MEPPQTNFICPTRNSPANFYLDFYFGDNDISSSSESPFYIFIVMTMKKRDHLEKCLLKFRYQNLACVQYLFCYLKITLMDSIESNWLGVLLVPLP